jgi:hypothetical protein
MSGMRSKEPAGFFTAPTFPSSKQLKRWSMNSRALRRSIILSVSYAVRIGESAAKAECGPPFALFPFSPFLKIKKTPQRGVFFPQQK